MKIYLLLTGLTIAMIANAQVSDMIKIGDLYVDKYEAPNIAGELPFVMFTYNEAESWCQARGKRLLLDDEWELVAGGPSSLPYVYGTSYDSSVCNDNETWLPYNQTLLNAWPILPYLNTISSFNDLIDTVSQVSASAAQAADEVMLLYQAENAGMNTACLSFFGVFDMNGNVSEWTTRSDGGSSNFHGNLKGGYWAEPRTIQANVTSHGDFFRHYYIGFRCAKDVITSTNQPDNNNESFIIFPNPATNNITITTTEKATIHILSIEGSIIKTINFTGLQTNIDVSNLSSGVYILRVITDKKTFTKKIIKK